MSQPQKTRVFSLKYVWSMLLMLVILAVTFLLLPKNYTWSEIKSVMLSANPIYLLAGFAMMLVYQLCIARCIQLLINIFTNQTYPIELSLKTAFIGFYFNNITPSASGGQPMEMYYLNKRGVDLSHSSMIFILLAIYYNITIIGVSLVALIFKFDLIMSSLGYIRYFMYYGYLFNGLITVLMILLVVRPNILRGILKGVSALLFRLHLIRSPRAYLRKMVSFSSGYSNNSDMLMKKPVIFLHLLVLHIIQIAALFSIPYFVSLSLGGAPSLFADSFSLQSMLYLATASVPTPGAVGITESGFITMFNSVMPAHQVIPGMFLTRLINLYGFLIVSALVAVYAFLTARRSREKHARAVAQVAAHAATNMDTTAVDTGTGRAIRMADVSTNGDSTAATDASPNTHQADTIDNPDRADNADIPSDADDPTEPVDSADRR